MKMKSRDKIVFYGQSLGFGFIDHYNSSVFESNISNLKSYCMADHLWTSSVKSRMLVLVLFLL